MAVTNFSQWNPLKTNQESDTQYASDLQRSGGAVTGEFPSETANKLFSQASMMAAAIGLMMANKGYSTSDGASDGSTIPAPTAALSTLASILGNILTNADIRGNLQSLSYSPALTLNVAQYLGFQIPLNGNLTLAVTGQNAGDEVTFIFVQDATGGRTVIFPSNFYGFVQPDPTANSISVQVGKVAENLSFYAMTPDISATGINATSIGATAPSTAKFISPASNDNSQNAVTTAWAKLGFAISLGVIGYIQFPTWLGGIILQWGSHAIAASAGTPTYINLPLTFPNQFLWSGVSPNANIDGYADILGATPYSVSQIEIYNSNNATIIGNWLAIGY